MYTWKYFIFLIVLFGLANFAAHGHALNDGLFLDDHWHILRLAENDWSPSAFFGATTIVPERFMNMWWQDQSISWWYIRPFAMLVSKVVYHLSGGSVKALHGLSILLHLANALMVHHLVLRMTRKRFWAIVAAGLLIVYSHSVYAVAWLAAQNALLQTTLMLAALLLYVRASGLDLYAAPCGNESDEGRPASAAPLSGWAAAGFFVLWILALLSRESAVILPVFVVAFDLAFGGRKHAGRRLRLYGLMLLVAAAFLAWRLVFFNHPMPAFYLQKPEGPGYVLWWLAKLLHYLTAVVWLSPMTIGPSARFDPWREVPGDMVLMMVILAIMAVGYQLATRRIRGYWIWPTWILVSLLPVVPILATPHNAYLPSIGFAVGMAIGPALRHETRPTSVGRWCTGVTLWFLIATTIYVPIYRPMWYSVLAAERMTIEQVSSMPPGPQARDVFFINVPFVNIYAPYHMDQMMGRGPRLDAVLQDEPRYRTYALTFAPDLLRMDQACRLEQLDPYRFRLSLRGERPYFSGALGRFLIESMRTGGPLKTGDIIRTQQLFDVTILQADRRGVWSLEFQFHQPLASDRFCFYVGTPKCAAARVRFAGLTSFGPPAEEEPKISSRPVNRGDVRMAVSRLQQGEPKAAGILFRGAQSRDRQVRLAAQDAIAEFCQPVAEALAAPVLEVTPSGRAAWSGWRQVSQWWSRHVDDAAVGFLSGVSEMYAARRWQRDALFRIRRVASKIIRADLYLTGPPFSGPGAG